MDESVATIQHKSDRTESSVTIDNLPTEMLWEVFSYLEVEDLASVCSVSRRWKEVGNGAPLMCQHEYVMMLNEDTEDEITTIFKSIPQIRKIKIMNPAIQHIDSVLTQLIKYCTDVRNLDIENGIYLKMNMMADVLKKFPKLESLSTVLWFDSMNVMKEISSCLELQTLVISTLLLSNSDVDLKPIADGCPSLIHLDIRECRYDSNDFIHLLKTKKTLRSLLFTGENFDLETVPPLSECTNLEHVACDSFSSKSLPFGVFLDEISSLPRLTRLDFTLDKDICKNDLKKLSTCVFSLSLAELNLKCAHVSEGFSRAIVLCFSKIRKLSIKNLGGTCGTRVLRQLLNLKELRHLEIDCWNFSRCWFEKLLTFRHIKTVVFKNIWSLRKKHCEELCDKTTVEDVRVCQYISSTN